MVDCRYLLKRVSASLNEINDVRLKMWLEENLKGCRRCHVVLSSPKAAVRIYAERGVVEVPAGFSQLVQRCLSEEAA